VWGEIESPVEELPEAYIMVDNEKKYSWKKIAGFLGALTAIIAAIVTLLAVIQPGQQTSGEAEQTADENFKMSTVDLSALENEMKEKIKQLGKQKKKSKRNSNEGIEQEEVGGDPVEEDKFIAHPSGVIYDAESNLEWFAGPDYDTYLVYAKEWVKKLDVAGGGWRLPTREELRTLYKKGAGRRNMVPVFKTTGWSIWSGEGKNKTSDTPSYAWCFSFKDGTESFDGEVFNYNKRAFAVRSREMKE